MNNVVIKKEGSKLTITVDLKKEFGKSTSGKSTQIASTLGNTLIDADAGIYMGLNVYKK